MTTPEHEHREPIDISDLAARAAGIPETSGEALETSPRTGRDRAWWDRTRADWSDDDEAAFNAAMAAAREVTA